MIRIALPTGDLRAPVSALLQQAGLPSDDYARGSRVLRLRVDSDEGVRLRVLREKDLPGQIGLGNYDLGICSGMWVEELAARFPQDDVVPLRALDFGHHQLIAATAPQTLARLGPLDRWSGAPLVRIASEFPAIAEKLALRLSLGRFLNFPLWGAAEAYPPEDADLVIVPAKDTAAVEAMGLVPLCTVLVASAWLVGNRRSLAGHNLSRVLAPLLAATSGAQPPTALTLPGRSARENGNRSARIWDLRTTASGATRSHLRLAIPDGHAQRHTFAALASAGLTFTGYEEKTYVRRPVSLVDGLEIKVIRPQDMAAQVAVGNYDLAVTGRDWLQDHRWQFPASPVREGVDLKRSRYSIAAAVSEDVPVETLGEAVAYWQQQGRRSIRVASEYPNIADHFARWRRLGRYQVIPVNGASEAYVPEDSEILIEGTETGSSFRANRLRGIDQVFESTNCVIVRDTPLDGPRRQLLDSLLERLRESAATVA